jgi:hypothetical protein
VRPISTTSLLTLMIGTLLGWACLGIEYHSVPLSVGGFLITNAILLAIYEAGEKAR